MHSIANHGFVRVGNNIFTREVATKHEPFNYFSELKALGQGMPPTLIRNSNFEELGKFATNFSTVTCVDPRCVPERFLGLQGAGKHNQARGI